MNILPKTSSTKAKAGYLAAIFGAVVTGYAAQNYVGPEQFALRETFGMVTSGVLPSGLYLHVPYAQYTHSYQRNTQHIHFNAGSCRFWRGCDSTADNNPLIADVVLNYQTTPDTEKLALHRWSMDGWVFPDGYWLLTGLMNDSANAVMGQKGIAETMANPQKFIDDFANDVSFRFAQNNIPVEIESLEVKGFKATLPANIVSNQIKRFKPNSQPK